MTDYNGKTVVPSMPGYDPNLDTGAKGAMYYPLVDWKKLTDTGAIAPAFATKLRDAYELGVTRAKAAKELYFMWVLAQPPHTENRTVTTRKTGPSTT